LHPAIHAGILARRELGEDMATLRAQGIQPIDVVAVNLYPFRQAAARIGATQEEVVEQIDIGGPSLLRAAAKNYRHVVAVVDAADYPAVLASLRGGEVPLAQRYDLMRRVFAHTAAYDMAIAEHFAARGPDGRLEDAEFPPWLGLPLARRQVLRYGENPHQKAAWYHDLGSHSLEVGAPEPLQGKELSYNNLLDLNAAIACLGAFERPTAVVVKHNTPCGVASAGTLEAAYRLARAADETSAFGGVVALNGAVDAAVARALAETFLEAVAAPSVEGEAREILAAKKNLRLLEIGGLFPGATVVRPRHEVRSVWAGLLVQELDHGSPVDWSTFRTVTKRSPTDAERRALHFAWRVVRQVRSNAIVFAAEDRTLAIGGGQTSRVEAVELAARKGGQALRGSAVASDAFFPFRDGLDAAAKAGATCVIQPGGSVRDAEVIAAADEHGMAMLFTGFRHFRH
ncbi:MAG TPA: bifunctional phosphoribosylaminoimidazolecarboxamide formyltransferase/IMP cyclohydrolase, partial [Myxococcales bacterium]|nr:bifunctional phosphoribosylaminoimidazolecarboxamide formyltransferase/IMP cyclohydrolase [Myxococcales bacterium]